MELLFLLLPALAFSMDISILGKPGIDPHKTISDFQHFWDSLHIQNFLPQLNTSRMNLSKDCKDEFHVLSKGIERLFKSAQKMVAIPYHNITEIEKEYILPIFDSSAKIEAGIMRGHLRQTGFYTECKMISYYSEELEKTLTAEYFRVFIDTTFKPYTEKGACDSPRVSVDVCLPASCTSDEVSRIFRSVSAKNKSSPVCQAVAINEMIPKPIFGTYVVWGLFGFIICLCIISGILDYIFLSQDFYLVNKPDYDFFWRVLMCFSLVRNVNEIFKIKEQKVINIISLNSFPGGTNNFIKLYQDYGDFLDYCMSLNGVCRLIFLYIFPHTYPTFTANTMDLVDYSKKWRMQFIVNGYFSVDTFFYLSGLLLGFIWFKMLKKNKKETMSLKGWAIFYLHRIVRISPAYYMALLFFTFVFTTLLTDKPILAIPDMQKDTCRQNWWINLLYLNNYIREENMCYIISWYLATDMQLYLASPLLLVPFAIFGSGVGISICLFVIAASTGISIYQTYRYDLPPSSYHYAIQHEMKHGTAQDYQYYQYYAPYVRVQTYSIGILTGYFLQNCKRLKLPKVLVFLLYIISIATMLSVIMALRDWISGQEISVFHSAMYNALSKPAWTLALSWIIIAIYYGYGGSFMSWGIWTPFGRLSFCAYLTHIPVILFIWGLDETERLESLLFQRKTEEAFVPITSDIHKKPITDKYYSSLTEVAVTKNSQNWT